MICCCEKCKFVFESIRLLDSCPDCGENCVRAASELDQADYAANRKLYGPMRIFGADDLIPLKEATIPLLVGVENGKLIFKECRYCVLAALP